MGTGGSRWGAGRPGWKRKAEQSLALDVRQLARQGLLKPSAFSWHWTSNQGEKMGSIGVRIVADPQRMILTYQWSPHGSEPRSVECSLWITHTACNYGGTPVHGCCALRADNDAPWCISAHLADGMLAVVARV